VLQPQVVELDGLGPPVEEPPAEVDVPGRPQVTIFQFGGKRV
jgi:hypothetical protein